MLTHLSTGYSEQNKERERRWHFKGNEFHIRWCISTTCEELVLQDYYPWESKWSSVTVISFCMCVCVSVCVYVCSMCIKQSDELGVRFTSKLYHCEYSGDCVALPILSYLPYLIIHHTWVHSLPISIDLGKLSVNPLPNHLKLTITVTRPIFKLYTLSSFSQVPSTCEVQWSTEL